MLPRDDEPSPSLHTADIVRKYGKRNEGEKKYKERKEKAKAKAKAWLVHELSSVSHVS